MSKNSGARPLPAPISPAGPRFGSRRTPGVSKSPETTMPTARKLLIASLTLLVLTSNFVGAQATRETATYKRIKAHLDSVPSIDTHDHLQPFEDLHGYVETDRGRGMNLF